jgi:four helix bundle protein
MGSGNEVEYLLLMAHDLGYMDHRTHLSLTEQVLETKRMLSGLLTRLRAPGLKLEA